jgi:hypothetical protein
MSNWNLSLDKADTYIHNWCQCHLINVGTKLCTWVEAVHIIGTSETYACMYVPMQCCMLLKVCSYIYPKCTYIHRHAWKCGIIRGRRVDVMITIICDFRQFSAKNLALFLKNQCHYPNFSKNKQYFEQKMPKNATKFLAKIFEKTSVPGTYLPT